MPKTKHILLGDVHVDEKPLQPDRPEPPKGSAEKQGEFKRKALRFSEIRRLVHKPDEKGDA